jgi:putative ABC transport system substrate-binding protein
MQTQAAGARLSRRAFVGRLAGVGSSAAGLVLLGGCGLVGADARPRVARLGFIAPDPVAPARMEALRTGLREHGWVEGQNLSIEERYADGEPERLPDLAAQLVRLPVDVIVGPGGLNIHAARQASATTPIVVTTSGDPVAEGLAASLARPGGNVTGLTVLSQQLNTKRPELLLEVWPGLARVAMLRSVTWTGSVQEIEGAAESLGLQAQWFVVPAADQLEAVFEAVRSWSADGLAVLADALLVTLRQRIVMLTAQAPLPAVYPVREYVQAGGLMSYGPDPVALYRRAAAYVDRILRGATPADLPFEQPRDFEFVVNLKTAETLALTLPPHVAAQVTEWIQ